MKYLFWNMGRIFFKGLCRKILGPEDFLVILRNTITKTKPGLEGLKSPLLLFLYFAFQVSLATFAIYVMTGNELTASKAFVAISLFNILRFPLVMFPNVIISLIQVCTYLLKLFFFIN